MNKQVIGINTLVTVANYKDIPAKIDTGADSSSIWASNIFLDCDKDLLSFSLFDEGSPFYNGEIIKKDHYRAVKVKSAMGQNQIRYKVQLSIKIQGKKINGWFNLADRSTNTFPVLIGRRTLKGKFIVDPSINNLKNLTRTKKVEGLKATLSKKGEINDNT